MRRKLTFSDKKTKITKMLPMALALLSIIITSGSSNTKPAITNLKEEWPLTIIRVPRDYRTIQEAINIANENDTILVSSGIYKENIIVNKKVSLIGKNTSSTTIESAGNGHVVQITANYITLSGFTIRGSKEPCAGIYVRGVSNIINGNVITDNYYGIDMYDSGGNTLRNNNFTHNKYNFRVWGVPIWHFIHDIDTSNTVDGKPIYYWVNQKDKEVPAEAGYVAIINSSNIIVKDLTLTKNEQGVLFAYTRNSLIKNITAANNDRGIQMISSHNNTITGNFITGNKIRGIVLHASSYNIINGNMIINNEWVGVYIARSRVLSKSSNNNTVKGNTITNNKYAIWLESSSKNSIIQNNITSNKVQGIFLEWSSNNIFTKNRIVNNTYGIWFHISSDNTIYHNNFINNTIQAYNYGPPYPINFWDADYPSGGNYWSDYIGMDEYSSLNQEEPESDGIGDTPYVIDADNIDKYPFMGQINFFNAGTWNAVTYYVDISSNSAVSYFYFNEGDKSISFNVTESDDTVEFGFCRVAIPKKLLWTNNPAQWIVLINNTAVTPKVVENANHTFIYFNYNNGTLYVKIKGVHAIPESPTTIIFTLFVIVTLILVIVSKRKQKSIS